MAVDVVIPLLKKIYEDKKEWKRLDEYIQSPFFNKNKKIIALWDLYKKAAPHFDKLTTSYLTRQLFGEGDKKKDQLSNHRSKLKKLIEHFLVQLKIAENKEYQDILWLEISTERKLVKGFEKKYKQVLAQHYKGVKARKWYWHHCLLNIHWYNFLYQTNQKAMTSIKEIVNSLDLFILATKLYFFCQEINKKRILKIDPTHLSIERAAAIALINEVDIKLETMVNTPHDALIKIYKHALSLLLRLQAEQDFIALKKLLRIYGKQMADREPYMLYGIALNYCTEQCKQSNQEQHYLNQLLELYEEMLVNDIFWLELTNANKNYKNFVSVAAKVGKIERAKVFAQTYKYKIEAAEREDAYQLSLAIIAFYERNYTEVSSYLSQITNNSLSYHIAREMLLIKSNIEEGIGILQQDIQQKNAPSNLKEMHLKQLESNLGRFKMYIKRRKDLHEDSQLVYKNFILLSSKFIDVFSSAISLTNLGGKEFKNRLSKQIDNLQKALNTTTLLVDKVWLQAKIRELHAWCGLY